MNYLITGSNGFIGKDLCKFLKAKGHNVTGLTRQDVDLADSNSAKKLPNCDVLVHCASSICRRGVYQDPSILLNNILINENILSQSYKYDRVFIFGSGAEFDQYKDVSANDCLKFYYNDVPSDYYGLSKYVSCLRAKQYNNIVYLRLYMVFGKNEPEDRFVKSCINNISNDIPITIHQNKVFGAISTYDIVKLLDPALYPDEFFEMNACYKPISLLNLCLKISKMLQKKPRIRIPGTLSNSKYYGENYKMQNLNVKLLGLDESLEKLIHNEN